MKPSVTLYSASAGTGKTYKICEEIAERVAAGLDPRRIAAATFTRKAAAELKSRVQGHLLAKGLVQKAEELELAAMGTVHSVGHQLISRFAVRLGLSPELAVLAEEDDSQGDLLKDILNRLDPKPRERLHERCARFELSTGIMLRLLKHKRQNAIPDKDFKAQLIESGGRLCEVIGARGKSDHGLPDASKEAQELARHALKAVEKIPGHEKESSFPALVRFVRYGADCWRDLSNLAKLEAENDRINELIAPLRDFSGRLLTHPGLKADITEVCSLLADSALELEDHYRKYKTERGLLDYTDLEELFYKLATDPAHAEELAEEIHLVVIDEFQDTNPIQLAIFMALSRLAKASIWVGDHKQSIYGFNGIDPELMHAVWKLPHVKTGRLETNRRSAKGLVELFNAIFTPVYGEESKMEPHRKAEPGSIERWLLEGSKNEEEQQSLANAVCALVEKGTPKSDIAVLCRTNDYCAALGKLLEDMGVPVALRLPGLLSSRECAIVRASLAVVADRQDSLACATLLHLLEGETEGIPDWFTTRLEELDAKKDAPSFTGQPVIEGLAGLDPNSLTPLTALTAVLGILKLSARVGDWSEPARRNTQLATLLDLARDYEARALSDAEPVTLTGFLAKLGELEADGQDFRSPPIGLDAVNVLTYHKSKGLEWPVVVLAQLDKNFSGDPSDPWVNGGDPKHGKPLDGRVLHYWPCPFGSYPPKAYRDALEASPEQKELDRLQCEEGKRILYVGFTRAREKLALSTRAQMLKKGEKHKHSWLDTLDSSIPAIVAPGSHHLPGSSAKLVVQRFALDSDTGAPADSHRWLESPKPAKHAFVPLMRNPSAEPPVAAEFTMHPLPGPNPAIGKVPEEKLEPLGSAMHAYFAALPSLDGASEKTRLSVASRIIESFGLVGVLPPESLVLSGQRLQDWVSAAYPGSRWHTEVPITAPCKDGRQWHGIIDLLLELPDGRLVVVDHKCAPLPEKALPAKAHEYSGQVLSYAEAVEKSGPGPMECLIHFPLGGGILGVASK